MIDETRIPTSTVLYDDSTKFHKAGRMDATIADLQTNDYVFVSFSLRNESDSNSHPLRTALVLLTRCGFANGECARLGTPAT